MSAPTTPCHVMMYDRSNSSTDVFFSALRRAAERGALLYLIAGCEAAPPGAQQGWTPLPADRAAEDLVALARMAQQHGLKLDGRVLTEPDSSTILPILRAQGAVLAYRADPGSPGAARAPWVDALAAAAQQLGIGIELLDRAA